MLGMLKKFLVSCIDALNKIHTVGMECRVIDKDIPVLDTDVFSIECYTTEMVYACIYVVKLRPDGPRLIPFWDQDNKMCVEDEDGTIYRIKL